MDDIRATRIRNTCGFLKKIGRHAAIIFLGKRGETQEWLGDSPGARCIVPLPGLGYAQQTLGTTRTTDEAVEEKEDKKGEKGAGGVEQGVPRRSGTGGDEKLMDFV